MGSRSSGGFSGSGRNLRSNSSPGRVAGRPQGNMGGMGRPPRRKPAPPPRPPRRRGILDPLFSPPPPPQPRRRPPRDRW